MEENREEVGTNHNAVPENGIANTSLGLGIASVFLADPLVFLPILAIMFGGMGLSRAETLRGKGRVQAWIGIVLGVLYLIVTVVNNIT